MRMGRNLSTNGDAVSTILLQTQYGQQHYLLEFAEIVSGFHMDYIVVVMAVMQARQVESR